jgi:hypothetical protein
MRGQLAVAPLHSCTIRASDGAAHAFGNPWARATTAAARSRARQGQTAACLVGHHPTTLTRPPAGQARPAARPVEPSTSVNGRAVTARAQPAQAADATRPPPGYAAAPRLQVSNRLNGFIAPLTPICGSISRQRAAQRRIGTETRHARPRGPLRGPPEGPRQILESITPFGRQSGGVAEGRSGGDPSPCRPQQAE